MNVLAKRPASLAICVLLGSGCSSSTLTTAGGSSTTTSAAQDVQMLADFNAVAAYFAQAHYDFVLAAQRWEGATITASNNAATVALADAYIDAGANWIAAAATLNDLSDQLSQSGLRAKGVQTAQGMAVPGIPAGPSPLLIRQLGNVLGNTQEQINDAKERYPDFADGASSDSDSFATEIQLIRRENTLTAARLGISAYAGIAGGVVTGSATYVAIAVGVITVSAPAAVVVGTATVLGGAATSAVAWWWTAPSTSCSGGSGTQKNTTWQGSGTCTFAAGSLGPGEAFPSQLLEPGGTLTLSIPGYLPITIPDFQPPTAGNQVTIDFVPVPLTEENLDVPTTVSMEAGAASGSTAADILSVSAVPSPVDPAPLQSVSVTVTVFPAVSGVFVSYNVRGTDGYTADSSVATNGSGQITFTIPGGDDGVHDVVDVSVGQHSYTVTYTF